MTSSDRAREAFRRAAIRWASGGRGAPLVEAAANALVDGLDSPTLRVLAGSPRALADEEATTWAADAFDELELRVPERLSVTAVVEAARLEAEDFLDGAMSPRCLARRLYGMADASGHPAELALWGGFDDHYSMLDRGTIGGSEDDVDAGVRRQARLLASRERQIPAPSEPPTVPPPKRRWWRRSR